MKAPRKKWRRHQRATSVPGPEARQMIVLFGSRASSSTFAIMEQRITMADVSRAWRAAMCAAGLELKA